MAPWEIYGGFVRSSRDFTTRKRSSRNGRRPPPPSVTLHESITFYLMHQGSPTGKKLWSEVVEQCLTENLHIGCSPRYAGNCPT